MNVELVAQMFKNYQSNVLFHLEGMFQVVPALRSYSTVLRYPLATENLKEPTQEEQS
jgi:hypothetical protein